jgi:hypothetical protein
MQSVELRLVFSVAVEHQDVMVLPVGDVDPPFRIAVRVVHSLKCPASVRTLFTASDPSARRVFVDTRIAIAVRNVNVLDRGRAVCVQDEMATRPPALEIRPTRDGPAEVRAETDKREGDPKEVKSPSPGPHEVRAPA